MILWIPGYLVIGLLAFLFVSRWCDRKGIVPSGFLFLDFGLFSLVTLVLWPLAVLITVMDADVQIKEKEEREQRELEIEKEQPEDLSSFIGSTGIVLTQLAPHGRIEIGKRQFDAVSDVGYLSNQTDIKVIGIAAFGELTVTKTEPGEVRKAVNPDGDER